ncbi:MAG: hypothetical protein EHM33_05085 [Chloroflexi bacterium]|jgi:hypothetical protein|nr:MAG: hypothetical protein EHM33_05085 [Chloroflexota bacterium]
MIDKPEPGGIVDAGWGIDVTNAINRIGVGILRAWSVVTEIQPGSTYIIPFNGVEHDARLFYNPEDGSLTVSEGRRGVYVVAAYLNFKGLADNEWGRAYLYRNGLVFAGDGCVGAGGTGVPLSFAGIDAFEEGDTLQVRVNVQSPAMVSIDNVSMTRIAENT